MNFDSLDLVEWAVIICMAFIVIVALYFLYGYFFVQDTIDIRVIATETREQASTYCQVYNSDGTCMTYSTSTYHTYHVITAGEDFETTLELYYQFQPGNYRVHVRGWGRMRTIDRIVRSGVMWYKIRRTLLTWYYRYRPPSLGDAYKTVNMLNPGGRLVYFAMYADGCHTNGVYNGYAYFEGGGGPRHAPHKAFVPDDKPIYEWGIKGIKNGAHLTPDEFNELSKN